MCTFYKKPRYIKDRCLKLHGKPQNQNHNWNTKGTRQGEPTHAHLVKSSVVERSYSKPTTNFNSEEITKPKESIDSLVKPINIGSSYVALSCISHDYALRVIQTTPKRTWFVDS